MANSLLGEITPAIATAIGDSHAFKILIPVNRCNHYVVGCQEAGLGDYLKKEKVGSCLRKHGIHLFAYQPDVFTETGLLASNYIRCV